MKQQNKNADMVKFCYSGAFVSNAAAKIKTTNFTIRRVITQQLEAMLKVPH